MILYSLTEEMELALSLHTNGRRWIESIYKPTTHSERRNGLLMVSKLSDDAVIGSSFEFDGKYYIFMRYASGEKIAYYHISVGGDWLRILSDERITDRLQNPFGAVIGVLPSVTFGCQILGFDDC